MMIVLINILRRWVRRVTRSEILIVVFFVASLVVISTLFYMRVEGWSFLDALYQTVITMTTIGYGDLSPQTPNGRLFAIFFSFFAIGIAGYAISTFAANLIENRLEKRTQQLWKRRMKRIDALTDHYILCGADFVGLRIAEEFQMANVPFLVIDNDEARLKNTLLHTHPEYFAERLKGILDVVEVELSEYERMSLPEIAEMLNMAYILADPTDDISLVTAGIDRAKGLVAALPDERDNLSVVVGAKALASRHNNDKLKIMARVENSGFVRKLYLAGADQVRIPSVAAGLEMAMHLLNPEIGKWWYTVMDINGSNAPRLMQVELASKPAWVGKTVGQLHVEQNIVATALKRDDKFISPPPADLVLKTADILIALVPSQNH